MEKEVKSCPFCGHPARQAVISNYPNQFVGCYNNDCIMSLLEPVYLKDWNIRAEN